MSAPPDAVQRGPRDQRLHPWSWLFVLLQQLKQFLLPLLVLVVFGGGRDGESDRYNHVATLVVMAILVGTSLLRYLTYRYRIGAEGLSIRSGLLNRSRREIPFARIHNVAVHQSLLHRLFGVAELRLESAGGVRPEAEMRVLRLDQALALEQLVKQRGKAPGNAPAATADPTDEVLLRMSTAEVIRLGLLSNRGWVLFAAAIGALLQVIPRRSLDGVISSGGREAFGYASQLHEGLAGLLILAALVLVAGWLLMRLLSVVLALLRYAGFTLTEQEHRLTVAAGLLSRTRSSVARRRIQAWTLREGTLQRWFGRRQLQIDSAAGGPTREEDRALRELAPLAPAADCDHLVQRLLPQLQWPPAHWQPVPQRGWWRLCLGSVLLVPLLAAAMYWRWGTPGLLVLGWLPVALWVAHRQMGRMGWHLDDRYVAVRGGWWRRWWRWAELDKLQGLRLQRSPLDRLLGTASLQLDTAGAHGDVALALHYLPHAQARALMAQLAAALPRRKLRW